MSSDLRASVALVIGDIVSKGSMSEQSLRAIYEMAGIRRDLKREQIPDFNLKVLESTFSGMLLNINNNEIWTHLLGDFNASTGTY